MRLLQLAATLLPFVVLADVGMRNGGTYLGPVKDIECGRDGGLSCVRDAGTSIGVLRCNSATATEPGCITPSDQVLGNGKKTFSDRTRTLCKNHGSLTACSSNEKGTWQTCCTHSAPVFCDGTDNHELLGTASDDVMLFSIHVNGIPPPTIGGITLPSNAGWTINAISGHWVAGTGTGSLRLSFSGTAGICSCDVDCDTPAARNVCTGNCTYAAGDTLAFARSYSGTAACTLDPYVGGNLEAMGVAQ